MIGKEEGKKEWRKKRKKERRGGRKEVVGKKEGRKEGKKKRKEEGNKVVEKKWDRGKNWDSFTVQKILSDLWDRNHNKKYTCTCFFEWKVLVPYELFLKRNNQRKVRIKFFFENYGAYESGDFFLILNFFVFHDHSIWCKQWFQFIDKIVHYWFAKE